MIYTLTLNPAIDYVIGLERLELGKINRTVHEAAVIGGKGINVSLVLAELGKPSTALGFTAGFTGEAIKAELQRAGIKHDFVELPSGMSRINVKIKAEEESEINGRGPEIPASSYKELLERLDALSDGDTLILAGSIPQSMPKCTYTEILEHIKASGKKIKLALDYTGEALKGSLRFKPYLIKPNIHELSELFGAEISGEADIIRAARELQAMGASNVLVSLGEDGAILADEHGELHKKEAYRGEAVNTVGAGDSMLAGFMAGAEHGYAYALALGTAAGGATAFKTGLAKRADIEALLGKLK